MSDHDGIEINSQPLSEHQSPFVFNFALLAKKASVVVEALSMKEIYVSTASACQEHSPISQSVLALGKGDRLAENSIRVSFGPSTTLEEVKTFYCTLFAVMQEVRSI